MSYVDQGMMSRGRVWAIVLVAILHALLGYAFVTGLAYKFVKNVQEDLKTFDVEDEPPPPEEEPPPPEQVEVQPPPVTAPPPLIRTNITPPPVFTAPPQPIQPINPLPPPPPPPPRTVEPARARANLASYVSDADYPASALRNEEQGSTRFRLTVGTDGRVTGCSVIGSSGSAALDNATCSIMRRRARFTPARDSNNNPTTDTVTATIRWVLPDE